MTAIRSLATLGSLIAGLVSAAAADLPAPVRSLAVPELASIPSFYLHVGAAGLLYDASAKISAFGNRIPGATVTVNDAPTVAAEVGYFLTSNIAVSVTGGYPPVSKFDGAGTLTGLGKLGKSQGGPAGLSVHYHFMDFGAFQPYIGGGLSMLVTFNAEDGLVTNLKVKHATGGLLQAGFDYMFDKNWGFFFDVKKVYIGTVGRGSLGGVPIKANVTLDPLVFHSGVSYRF